MSEIITPAMVEQKLRGLSKEVDDAHKNLVEVETIYHSIKAEYEIAMAKSHQRFAGDYDKFPKNERKPENQLSGHNFKNEKLVQDGEISYRALYVIILMSNCPDKDCD